MNFRGVPVKKNTLYVVQGVFTSICGQEKAKSYYVLILGLTSQWRTGTKPDGLGVLFGPHGTTLPFFMLFKVFSHPFAVKRRPSPIMC